MESHEDGIKIGDRVVDTISAYRGIVTARCEYADGTVRLLVEAEGIEPKAGTPIEGVWFDEGRLLVMDEEAWVNKRIAFGKAIDRVNESRLEKVVDEEDEEEEGGDERSDE